MTITQMSLAGAFFIAAVFIVRAALLTKMPKKLFLLLWEIALLRLLVPIGIPSPLSIFNLIGTKSSISSEQQADINYGNVTISENADNKENTAPADILSAVRIAGTAVFSIGFGAAYIICRKRFLLSRITNDGYAAKLADKIGLKRRVTVRISDSIHSPLTYGIWRPVILLPADTDMTDR